VYSVPDEFLLRTVKYCFLQNIDDDDDDADKLMLWVWNYSTWWCL